MDFKPKDYKKNSEEHASLLSKLFFHWVRPILKIGHTRELTVNDVYNAREEDRAEKLGDQCQEAWDNFNNSKNPADKNKSKLLGLLVKIHGKKFVCYGLLLITIRIVFTVSPTIFLRLLTKSFVMSNADDNPDHGRRQSQYLSASGLCFSTLVFCLFIHWINYEFFHIGVKCSVGLSSLIYRKILRLSKLGQTQTTIGQLINLISNDVKQFTGLIHFLINIISSPLQTGIFIYMLWLELGNACFPGVGILFILGPCQYFLGIYSAQFRRKLAKRTDARAHKMNEIINGIRIIKMYAWEKPFSKLIHTLRINEIKEVTDRAYVRALYVGIYNISVKITAFVTVMTVYLSSEHQITADKVFFATSVYYTMCNNMLFILPEAIAFIGEIGIAAKRIQTFLDSDEKKSPQTRETKWKNPALKSSIDAASIKMTNVSAQWTPDKITLDNLNFEVSGNKLVMVLGRVGSGKSSFLNVLLEELRITAGNLETHGIFSYVSQEPWIFSGTIRQNITFGAAFNQAKYDKIIHCCSLNVDLQQWPFGDTTVIGEKGITLSGGQKARIGLARAIYHREADIYLFDDPLSAVDSNVSRHIFDECIMKHLQGRTRILVTHQLQYLSQADHIVVLDNGKIIVQGTYQHIVNCNIDLMEFLSDAEQKNRQNRKASEKGEKLIKNPTFNDTSSKEKKSDHVNDEKSAEGSVTGQTYWKYINGGKSFGVVIFLAVSFIGLHGLIFFSDIWLAKWTSSVGHKVAFNLTEKIDGTSHNININQETFAWVYSVLAVIIATTFLSTSFVFYRYAMKIGTNLHDEMFSAIVRAPMKFFDQTSSGRIMNRFTKDLSSIDESLPISIYEVIEVFLKSFSVFTIVMWTTPFMIVPTAVALTIMFTMRSYYVVTSRSLKRIEATSRSPIFTFPSSTFHGLDTIRALDGQEKVIQQFDAQLNIHTSTLIIVAATNRWFSFWIQSVCVVYLFIATFGVLVISTSISSGNVGLAISSAMMLVSVQWALRQSAETENLMTCVERVLEFIGIKPEAAAETLPENKPQNHWPENGEIAFENVSLSYNDDNSNLVLNNLSFNITGLSKIGIIGRTGAGKSSIITALFRLKEICSGRILIDGVDIQNIGLHQLRESIAIIPQDPVLFSGTIRYNLDPFDQHEDSEIWMVLEQVELKDVVGALDFQVADSGTNFSVGQRQLVCLARALLRQTKIIVLDEATANCDVCTDMLIQTKLKQYFSNCTTITIAHRIHTVMDSDKILILDNGNLKEYDSPSSLLENTDRYFSQMVRQAGLDVN